MAKVIREQWTINECRFLPHVNMGGNRVTMVMCDLARREFGDNPTIFKELPMPPRPDYGPYETTARFESWQGREYSRTVELLSKRVILVTQLFV